MPDAVLTTSQINKAGRTLRKWIAGETSPEMEAIHHAFGVLISYRAAHNKPLGTANMGLRSMVRTAGCVEVERIAQRLKRIPTIVDKLQREPTLPLASMQDIGGVRAVLNSIDEIRRVEARLRKNRPVVHVSDYVAYPRRSGYRGLHVIVLYGEPERKIEVQLRTKVMHDWAVTVERVSGNSGKNFKQDGDHPVQDFLAIASQAMALEEEGGTVDAELMAEFRRVRALAEPFIGQRRRNA